MAIVLHHHPFTRAANVVWMLEEVGVSYDLNYIDLHDDAHRRSEHLALNPMGKLPVLTDGEAVVTETAAIGVYLADRYAPGRLAPALDDPARGTYLRWSFFAPSVIEPGCMAQAAKWEFRSSQAGWGEYERMLDTIERAIGEGPWLLGETFTMADVIFGGTVRFMLQFGMIEKRASFEAYADRLADRPAAKAAEARNAAVIAERDLLMPGI